jgi:GT2 family glycosyltransferase
VIELSIAIVSFNTSEVTQRTIAAAIADTSELDADVIVVDNGSRDGSVEAIRERFPAVTVIANRENRYYSAANNQALAAARGHFILVLNSDAEPRSGTLPAMVAHMKGHPDIGALSPLMRFPDGRLQRNCARQSTFSQLMLDHSFIGFLLRDRRQRARHCHWYGDWDRLSEQDVDVVPGSCMMVSREAVTRTGGFDERLRLYFAEDDWCARIRAAGLRVAYAPLGTVTHAEGVSTVGVRRLARRLYFDDMVKYATKHLGRFPAVCLWVLTRPTIWAMAAADILRGR